MASQVYQCLSAIVGAFRNATEITESLRQRVIAQTTADIEQSIQLKLLENSLLQGEKECTAFRGHGEGALQQSAGDAYSAMLPQLKDVVVDMQIQLIMPLQLALQDVSASLECVQLLEAAILNRTATVRIMHKLDERRTTPGASSETLCRSGDALTNTFYDTAAVVAPEESTKGSTGTARARQFRGQTMGGGRSIDASQRQHSTNLRREGALSENNSLLRQPLPFPAPQQEPAHSRDTWAPNHKSTSSVGSSSHYSTDDIPGRSDTVASNKSGVSYITPRTPSSSGASISSSRLPDTDDQDDKRASNAPELVTKEYESMLFSGMGAYRHTPERPPPPPPPPRSTESHSIHTYAYPNSPDAISPGVEAMALPLARLALAGEQTPFCIGATRSRIALQEGLSIVMIQDQNSNAAIPHWKCKSCQFRWRANSSSTQAPDFVLFHKGIRYRWLFLAKSHVSAEEWHSKIENYRFACMICSAQGHTSSRYNNRDDLLNHILAKHKTWSLTPEVKESIKCLVGGVPDRSDERWDINLPESRSKSFTGKAGEHVLSAVTGISSYGV